MEKVKSFITVLLVGIAIGVIAVVVLVFAVRATPHRITIGGVEFEIPTSLTSQDQAPQIVPSSSPTDQGGASSAEQTDYPEVIVSANASNGVLFTAPIDANYRFTMRAGVYCTPTICRSIIHGYIGREVVWKDWYGHPHPMDQDYEMGCWENATVSNQNCAVGQSTVVHLAGGQYIRWVIMEDRDSFGDNRGEVMLAVTRLP